MKSKFEIVEKLSEQFQAVRHRDMNDVRKRVHELTDDLACAVATQRDGWTMAWADFVGELMTYWGARHDSEGAWRLPCGLVVSLTHSPFNSRVEHGWQRWQLPGFDGATRGRLIDRKAPFIVHSPNGRWFWCFRNRMQPMHWSNLIEVVAQHAIDSRAQCGVPVASTVRADGGAA